MMRRFGTESARSAGKSSSRRRTAVAAEAALSLAAVSPSGVFCVAARAASGTEGARFGRR
jgi:hypothetical protein